MYEQNYSKGPIKLACSSPKSADFYFAKSHGQVVATLQKYSERLKVQNGVNCVLS